MQTLYDYFRRFVQPLSEAVECFRSQTPDGFIHVVERLLTEAIGHLEEQANFLKGSREDAITVSVLGFLTRYGIRAKSQTNSRGHVDIYISHSSQSALAICGEAKIWRDLPRILKGMEQVLRYSTGRCPFCFILIYIQNGRVADRMETLQNELNQTMPHAQQAPCSPHPTLRWAFMSPHLHSSGEPITLLHAGVNLVVP